MIIEKIEVTDFRQNCRLVIDENTKVGAVIDPGGEVNRVFDLILKKEVRVPYIFLTHGHLDHVGGASRLKEMLLKNREENTYEISILAHKLDFDLLKNVNMQSEMFGSFSSFSYENVDSIDISLEDGDKIKIGSLDCKILHIPGHSLGHIVLYFENETPPVLFSGDTLFCGSIGRGDLPGGNQKELIRNIKNKLLVLPEETRVLSGHGIDTTIGEEKRSNPFLF